MTDTPAPHEGATPRVNSTLLALFREMADNRMLEVNALTAAMVAVNAYDPEREREGKVKALVEAARAVSVWDSVPSDDDWTRLEDALKAMGE